MDSENGFAATDIGPTDDDATVETTRAQKGRIEYVRAVGCGNQDDAFIGLEAVHFDQ